MLYAVIVTVVLVVIGFIFILRRAGSLSLKPLEKMSGMKEKQNWAQSNHVWETSSQKGIFYCNICSKLISGWLSSSQMMECKICGAVKHYLCNTKEVKCKQVVCSVSNAVHSHQWLDGNLPMNSICNVCQLTCGSIYGLDGSTCLWCQRAVHKDCKEQLDENCDFGKLKKAIISPLEIKVVKAQKPEKEVPNSSIVKKLAAKDVIFHPVDYKITLEDDDESRVPIIAIVNKTSGGQVGNDILKSFYRYLNPIQVIDLIEDGLEKLKIFRQLKRCKILVGGGDGTIGSVLSYVNSEDFREGNKLKMPVGILPLGTGNDLSCCLGWGATFVSTDAMGILRSIGNNCEEILLDQWTVNFTEEKPATNKAANKTAAKTEGTKLSLYNYCGIGLDAKMALNFHNLRKSYPYLFKSRVGNKFIYTQRGLNHLFAGKKIMLSKCLKVYCDDKLIILPDVEGIIIQNITYWGGGIHDIWNDSTESTAYLDSEPFFSDSVAGESENVGQVQTSFKKQSYCDGVMEVVGFSSILHMGRTQTGLAKPVRICQGSNIEIHIQEGAMIPFQIDGEPFEVKGNCKMVMKMEKRVDVLVKKHYGKTPIETKVLKVLDWAEGKNYINETQRHVLLDQFLRTLGE